MKYKGIPLVMDTFSSVINAANRKEPDGVQYIHCTADFISRIRKCTLEEADAWADSSPLATYMGGGWWSLSSRVETGACSRLSWPE